MNSKNDKTTMVKTGLVVVRAKELEELQKNVRKHFRMKMYFPIVMVGT